MVLLTTLTVLMTGCTNENNNDAGKIINPEVIQPTPEPEQEMPATAGTENLAPEPSQEPSQEPISEPSQEPSKEPIPEPNQESKADTPATASGEDTDLDTANLRDATVIKMLDNGAIARPPIVSEVDGGGVAAVALGEEEEVTDITLEFTADTIFQIVEINRSTYEKKFYDGKLDDVELHSSVYVWGSYTGTTLTAKRVVIARFV